MFRQGHWLRESLQGPSLCLKMQDQNLIITVPADVLVGNSARPSEGTFFFQNSPMMMCSHKIFHCITGVKFPGSNYCGLVMPYGIIDISQYWFSAKPLPQPMLTYCVNWTLRSKPRWNFDQNSKHFHWSKLIWKCCLQNSSHFVSASIC